MQILYFTKTEYCIGWGIIREKVRSLGSTFDNGNVNDVEMCYNDAALVMTVMMMIELVMILVRIVMVKLMPMIWILVYYVK